MFFLTIISLFICVNVTETALNLTELEILDKSIPKERTIKIRENVTYIKRSGDSSTVSHQSLPIFWPQINFDQPPKTPVEHQTALQSLPFDHNRSVVNHRFTNFPSSSFYPVEPDAQNGGPLSMMLNGGYPIGPPPQPMPPAYATFPQPPSTGPTTSCKCCCCPSAASRNCPCAQNCHPPCCGAVTQTATPTTTTTKTTTEKTTTTDPSETTTTTSDKTPTTLSSTTTNPHRPCCPPMIINCPNNRAPCFMNGGGCSTGPCIFPPFIDGTGGYHVGMSTYPGGYLAVPSFPGVPMPNYAPGGGHYPTVPESPGIYPTVTNYPVARSTPYDVALPSYAEDPISRGSAFAAKSIDQSDGQAPTSKEDEIFKAKLRHERPSSDLSEPKKMTSSGAGTANLEIFISILISFGVLSVFL
uniref:Uncharacterized protein n=1 Tax=Globodera pallida TaxID=36090 RepID=A0A183BK01_GLOPA